MAEVVLAMATTHGPQLHTTPEQWLLRVPADRARLHPFRDGVYSFDELVDLRAAEGLASQCSHEAIAHSHRRCRAAMETMADTWAASGADVAIILGNDQEEVFGDEFNPSFAVFYGDKIPNYPQSDTHRAKAPPGVAEGEFGHATRAYTEYDGVPELGTHIMRDQVAPNVPIFQNTFYPPNQPSAKRAYAFGKALRETVDGWPASKRVAIIASGGMSHFVIDESFDERFITALRQRDRDFLTAIPLNQLQSGTSELKSWISLAGFLEKSDAHMHQVDYVPCYRSPAGTGSANGFFWWDRKPPRTSTGAM
jgi:hypothetical protein